MVHNVLLPPPLPDIYDPCMSPFQALLDTVDALNGGRIRSSSIRSSGAIPGAPGQGGEFDDGSEADSVEIKAKHSANYRVEVGS